MQVFRAYHSVQANGCALPRGRLWLLSFRCSLCFMSLHLLSGRECLHSEEIAIQQTRLTSSKICYYFKSPSDKNMSNEAGSKDP